ncbi:MAG TPA: tail fiber protein [Pyrinomonadaceae bacterium]|jgi:microcystin-dependent protein
MSQPFVAEIRIVGFSFAPRGWAFCNGQILPISQNTALFSLLGTMYGGNGQTTFALPNLQGSAPMQQGQGPGLSEYFQGAPGGEQFVTLIDSEIPAHTHTAIGTAQPADLPNPDGNNWAQAIGDVSAVNYYNTTGPNPMSPFALQLAGGSQPHNNMHPYLTLNFIIALQGVFPPRS